MARGALAAALASVLLASAGALKSVPAVGAPCSTVDKSNPGYSTCDASYVVVDFYSQLKAGQLDQNGLMLETAGNCAFLEDAFEETFTANTVRRVRLRLRCVRVRTRLTRARRCWRGACLAAQPHALAAGGAGRAGALRCAAAAGLAACESVRLRKR
jgi:hypothetical protein